MTKKNLGRAARMGVMTGALATACVLAGAVPASALTYTTTIESYGVGDSAGDAGSYNPDISADARYVVFESEATNLVPDDTNGTYDVFLRDRSTGAIERLSVDPSGNEGDGSSNKVEITPDGRYVVFDSQASNLVAGDTNGIGDIFIRDVVAGTTERVSVASDEVEAGGTSYNPSVSSDGRFVVFHTGAALVADDTNFETDIYVRDRTSGTTVRASVSSDEVETDNSSYNATISNDGRYVAFESEANNLVAGDTGRRDIFVRDLTAGTTVRVSVDSSEAESDNASYEVSMSGDGRYVAFESNASNLVAGDTNGKRDIFVRDMTAGTTILVSQSIADVIGNDNSDDVNITSDGKFLAFESQASNLVEGDTNGQKDVFRLDMTTGTLTLLSINDKGEAGNCNSEDPILTTDGFHVVFESQASNLATLTSPAPACVAPADLIVPAMADDTNYVKDIFVYSESVPEPEPPTPPLPPTGSSSVILTLASVLLGAGVVSLVVRRIRLA